MIIIHITHTKGKFEGHLKNKVFLSIFPLKIAQGHTPSEIMLHLDRFQKQASNNEINHFE